MTADRPSVSDHAVVAYLERVYGLEIDRVRAAISSAIADGAAAAEVAGHDRFAVVVGRVRFAIERGEVVTVALRPQHRRARQPRRRGW